MMGRIWSTWKALLYNRVVECVSGQRYNTHFVSCCGGLDRIAEENQVHTGHFAPLLPERFTEVPLEHPNNLPKLVSFIR